MSSPLLDRNNLLPSSEELPDSDDTPVDNEYQNTLPNWLLSVLEEIWSNRQDWYFGVDMGIYDREGQKNGTPVLVPDGFLSIGVPRHKRGNKGRLSYVLQEEKDIAPILALEYVSKTYNGEYKEKMQKYARLGVKYYLIYNPEYYKRDKHEAFEMYQLRGKSYHQQKSEPCWLEELDLGIGRERGELGGIEREWLAWFDQFGHPYALPSQLIRQERQRAEQERQRAEQERQRAEQERQRVRKERQRAEQERQRAEQERQRAEQLEQALEQERQRAEQTEQALEQTEQALEQERLEKLRLLEKLRQLEIEP